MAKSREIESTENERLWYFFSVFQKLTENHRKRFRNSVSYSTSRNYAIFLTYETLLLL